MDFLTANVNHLYHKYLVASIARALTMLIYSSVGTIAVGQL